MKRLPLPAKLAILVVVMALPFGLMSLFLWPGAFGGAFFGILVGCLAWLNIGWQRALVIGAVFAVLTIPANLLHSLPWLAALAMFVLILAFGATAARGLAGAVLPVAFLFPYYLMTPPPIFSTEPATVNLAYLLTCAGLALLGACWSVLLLHLALPKRTGRPRPDVDPGLAWAYAAILAVFSSAVVFVGLTYFDQTHWAWITLTLFILANPNTPMNLRKMRDRILGNLGGFVLIAGLLAITTNRTVMSVFALVCMYLALYFTGTGKPYWLYCMFLAPAVVSMDSLNSNPWIMANERIEFTLLGAVLAIVVAFVAALIMRGRAATAPEKTALRDESGADDTNPARFDSHLN